MSIFNMSATADDIQMIEKSIKSGTPISFLAVDEDNYAWFITFNTGLLTLESKYDSYEYPCELFMTSSGKILAIQDEESVVMSIAKLEKLIEE